MGMPILEATGVTKRFGPVEALRGVDFHVEPGEVHALLGINGAGKSTFIKILSGLLRHDGGTLTMGGRDCTFRGPDDAIAAGIATVQQHPELVPDMSGLSNIFLGRESVGRGLLARIDRAALERRAEALLARFAVPLDLSRPVSQLSAVDREAVAVLQALAGDNIKVLILDEPTSTLTDVEREDLFRMMRHLRAQGIAIIYITHQLEEVFAIADSFSVFRGGTCVARMTVADARAQDRSLATLMLGEEIGDVFPAPDPSVVPGRTVLDLDGLTVAGAFDGARLSVRKGEVLGIFGLVGSGCEELAQAIFGVTRPSGGRMTLKGRPYAPRSPREALDAGVFLVPGDRRTQGLALGRDALFNVPLANLRRASGGRWTLRRRRIRADAQALTQDVALHPPSLVTPASGFSGGNQQKIVLAKGLYAQADLYVFVEPTVGVDIGARARIYALIRALARKAAVIVVSSDCDEVNGIADRTVAMHKGHEVAPHAGRFSRDALLMAGIMGEVRS